MGSEEIANSAPIGVFDSGFGGLTVARAIADLLPHENLLYLGDTARTPYGPRDINQVREFTLQALDWLVARGVKALVIACNTGSSAALREARERYRVPVIDVITPAARKAALITRNGKVGVICTAATAASGSYDAAMANRVELTTQVCPEFVPLVEEGITAGPQVVRLAQEYLTSIKQAEVDTLILGCTHYPLLSGVISMVLGQRVALVSSSDECARSTFATMSELNMLRDQHEKAKLEFHTTGDPSRFEGLGSRLLGGFVSGVQQVTLN